jgi:hypothetical protein
MAITATTISSSGSTPVLKASVVDVTFDNSYPAGGYAVSGLGQPFEFAPAIVPMGSPNGYVVVFNPATGKLQVFQQAAVAGALPEVAAAVNLSAVTVRLLVLGR